MTAKQAKPTFSKEAAKEIVSHRFGRYPDKQAMLSKILTNLKGQK